jgi:signal transduction histidine kinase
VENLRPAAQAKEISLELQLNSLGGQVSGDADRLQQVAWNLISNAIKFTPAGGRVLVRLSRVESHLEMTVKDTGQGIEGEFLPHVFDRFRQADATVTRAFGGLGLGLAIVRQLVELHGGTVRVDSEGEGRGSTFTVSLPLMAARGAE